MSKEPAVIIAFVMALIQASMIVAMSFGLRLTVEQQAAIGAVITLIGGFITRQYVSPVGGAK